MNRRLLILLLGTMMLAVFSLARADPPEAPRADPRIVPLLAAVDAGRISRDIERLAAFGTRNTLSATDDPVRGIGAAQRWVHQELERISAASGGRLRVEDDPFTVGVADGFPRTTQITNTIATLPGTDPNRVLVVSGHLDSRGTDVMNGKVDAPGADDDASGVAAVLEMARLLAPRQLRATLVFMAVSGEEQGLYGSRHWAQAARAQTLNIEAMFTNDIIGSGRGANGVQDTEHVRVFSEAVSGIETQPATDQRLWTGSDNDSPSRELARAVADAQRRYLPGFGVALRFRRDRVFRGGDHIAFNEAGYAAVRFTEMNEDYRHQHQDVRVLNTDQFGDLLQYVNPDYVANVTRVNLAALADLGWAPPAPAWVGLDVERTPTHPADMVHLSWPSPVDASRLGYEVLWRETNAADWQGMSFVGDTKQARLSVSSDGQLLNVDDYLFAVRAVSPGGNRSVPVVAQVR
jgi:Peptidase family M28